MLGFAAVATLGVLARPLLPVDETRYLTVAWEMRIDHNWLVPRLNGELYAHKPPLLFWLINLVWSVFGVSETAARMIGPAFGTAAIGVTGLLARRLWPAIPGSAGRAALVLAGFGTFAIYAGLTMFDSMLTLATLLGILALTTTGAGLRGWLWFGAALAFGALAKGPVILVHLLPLALTAPLWTTTPMRSVIRGLPLAIATGLGLVGLWLVPAILTGGAEYRDAVLWTQSAGRVGGSFGHSQPVWFFLALLPLLLWPWGWSPALWRRAFGLPLCDRGVRLGLIWTGASLLIFSLISGKQAHYLLPTLPGFALLAARALDTAPLRLPLAGLLPAAFGLVCFAVAFGLVPGADLAPLADPLWASLVIGLLLLALAASSLRLAGSSAALLGLGLAVSSSLVFGLSAAGPIYDSAPMAEIIAPHDAAGIAIIDGRYNGEFSFAARLRQPVNTIADLAEAEAWLASHPQGVLIGDLDRPHPATPPVHSLVHRGETFGVWTGASVPKPAS